MALTKITRNSFKDGEVKTANIDDGAITNAKIGGDAVADAGKVTDNTITADDLSSTLDLSSKTVTLPDASFNNQFYNVGLLGFKMAVTDS